MRDHVLLVLKLAVQYRNRRSLATFTLGDTSLGACTWSPVEDVFYFFEWLNSVGVGMENQMDIAQVLY
jgi:hypothetical protein